MWWPGSLTCSRVAHTGLIVPGKGGWCARRTRAVRGCQATSPRNSGKTKCCRGAHCFVNATSDDARSRGQPGHHARLLVEKVGKKKGRDGDEVTIVELK